MKNLFRLLIVSTLVLAGLVATGAAQEPGISKRVKFNFPFNVGKKEMPAGEYRIRLADNDPSRRLLIFEQLDGKATALLTTMREVNRGRLMRGAVAFNKYGEQRYFSGIQLGDETYILQALKSGDERKLIKEAQEIAKAKNQKLPLGN